MDKTTSNNHLINNLKKDSAAKFVGRTQSLRVHRGRNDPGREELRITFDLPTDAADRLEAFAKQCLDDQNNVRQVNEPPHYELLDLGLKSLQFEGDPKIVLSKASTSSEERQKLSKNISKGPSLLINLLNQDSSNCNKITENCRTAEEDDDKRVRLKLKMPCSTSITALTTPKLPSETSLSIVNSAPTTDDVPPPKVPKLIVSMRNKTIKTSSITKEKDSSNHRKRSVENSQESMEPTYSQKNDECLNVAATEKISNISKKVNGSSMKATNIAPSTNLSPTSSPPSSVLPPSTSSNPTKMVPVKLVTVSKGDGNVRLVRVSPVRSSPPTKLSSLTTASSSDSHKNEVLENGNNFVEEVPSSSMTDSDEHNPSRKRPGRNLNSQECMSNEKSGESSIIDNRRLTKT